MTLANKKAAPGWIRTGNGKGIFCSASVAHEKKSCKELIQ